MSAVLKKVTWAACCDGCLAEYGGPFFEKEWAVDYAKNNPLCPDCDGENY